MVDYENMVGKFLCHRKDAPMDDGLIYRVTSSRICYTNCGDRWITKQDFENRTGLDGKTLWFWVQDGPIDTTLWNPNIIEKVKKEKKILMV